MSPFSIFKRKTESMSTWESSSRHESNTIKHFTLIKTSFRGEVRWMGYLTPVYQLWRGYLPDAGRGRGKELSPSENCADLHLFLDIKESLMCIQHRRRQIRKATTWISIRQKSYSRICLHLSKTTNFSQNRARSHTFKDQDLLTWRSGRLIISLSLHFSTF